MADLEFIGYANVVREIISRALREYPLPFTHIYVDPIQSGTVSLFVTYLPGRSVPIIANPVSTFGHETNDNIWVFGDLVIVARFHPINITIPEVLRSVQVQIAELERHRTLELLVRFFDDRQRWLANLPTSRWLDNRPEEPPAVPEDVPDRWHPGTMDFDY